MVADAFPQFDPIEEDGEGEEHHDPNPEAIRFYQLLESARKPLWEAQNARQVYYMPYPDSELNDSPRANWMVVVKCKPRGRIETQEVLVADEAYQNAKDIPVRIVTDTGTPETLRSVTGELDIVNTQVLNNENQIDSEVEECNREDNESASADSISTQESE
ncbi:hypothetical protein PIB30_027433 [Stylosanthes scabra]|uniref:Uncharacterized protein n=1 Tax=Stylosanthes scabra TaxID=79078 RepID=A0ABU6X877_9FABA|nr:hypothetical protein [Stylosanthes scabra]